MINNVNNTSRVPGFIEARRSIRSFTAEPVPLETLDALVEAACIAPAPHHSRPWRFVVVHTEAAKQQLAHGMGAAWRDDLRRDGADLTRIDELVESSHRKLIDAPAMIVGCLTWNGLDRYPDEPRQRAEWGMALLSLGAAVENPGSRDQSPVSEHRCAAGHLDLRRSLRAIRRREDAG